MKKFFKKKEPTEDELRDSLETDGIMTGRSSIKPRKAKFSQYSDYAKQLSGGRNGYGPNTNAAGSSTSASGNPYAKMNQTNNMASNPYANLNQDQYATGQSTYSPGGNDSSDNINSNGYNNEYQNVSSTTTHGNSLNGYNSSKNMSSIPKQESPSDLSSVSSTPTPSVPSPYTSVESSYSSRFGSNLARSETIDSYQVKREELFQGVDRSKLRIPQATAESVALPVPRSNGTSFGSSSYHPRDGLQSIGSDRSPGTQLADDDDLTGATPIPPPAEDSSYASQQVQEIDSEEEDVDAVKQQLRFTKQESVASSRNALRLAEEAEESGRNTLGMLGSQSERLSNVEQNISLATTQNKIAEEKAKELKTLNRSMFAIHVGNPFNSKRRLQEQEDKIRMDRALSKEESEHRRQILYQSQQRVQNALGDFGSSHAVSETERKYRTKTSLNERSRYQFEADEEDDALENELDANLDALGGAAGRLRKLAVATGEEVQRQNERLNIISDSADNLDINVHLNTTRLANIR
ncbi:hypothetical protein NADFUDRAFT_83220 [Nadsonia fulvescens var. elongata DSM 6958]|uniref:t-SNARE coiled-coil homology domain-containing protein n=1 Tax=Nadsonia fulvescens var. elongata DSM 6958 TaxID=857566 RepID=A0A1E3PIB8_9ASCO|nr:hypothetical protein NADFUDRAFT_83220 [Nadsonia fulvescens var. elongata DSM 6958]